MQRLEPALLRRTVTVAAVAWLVGVMVLACASTSTPERPHPNLEEFWREYVDFDVHKAIAVAGSLRGSRWVAGASAGHPDVRAAVKAALEECGERRILRRVQAACVVYAKDEKIVWRGY